MRLKITLSLLFLLAFVPAGLAQMFSTVQECDQLYGKPTPSTEGASDVRFYKHEGMSVKILFVDNKSAVLTFTSLTSLKLPKEVQAKLLDASAAGNKWNEVEGEGALTWRRSDGHAFAIYDNSNGELNIFSTEYIEKAKAEVQTAINQQ